MRIRFAAVLLVDDTFESHVTENLKVVFAKENINLGAVYMEVGRS